MDHNNALETHAAERYVLGEMNAPEAEAFEQHYFACTVCSREVHETLVFADGAREALRADGEEEQRVVRWTPQDRRSLADRLSEWFRPWALVPYAATLVLGLIVAWHSSVTIPGLKQAAAPTAVDLVLLRGPVRQAPQIIEPGAPVLLLGVDVNAPGRYPRYEVEFRSETDEVVMIIPEDAPEIPTIFMTIAADRFPAGRYTMVLYGLSDESTETRARLDEIPFVVRAPGEGGDENEHRN